MRGRMETVIELSEVSREFNGRPAVQGLSLRLGRGAILGLLGPNGAGKTTALRMMAGVLPPSRGSIRLLGRALDQRRPGLRRHLGYLPDSPPLYDDMAVTDYLTYVARLRGLTRGDAQRRCALVLDQCDLGAVARRRVGNLSRGYRQRVGLAQAVIHAPALLLLDEPTLGLDPVQVRGLRELIGGLRETHAIILSSHLLAEVQSLCDQVFILRDGRCVYAGELGGAAPGEYRLVTRNAIPLEDVSALPGVASARADGERAYRLSLADPEAAEPVLRAALDSGWGVAEWGPAAARLETLFLERVHGRA